MREKLLIDLKIKLGRLYEFLEPFIVELESITYGYPASKEYHHSSSNGLFIHSLEVANKMIEIFEDNRDEYLPRYENEKTGEYQSRYEKMLFYLATAGLLHDVGKIGVYERESRWYYIPFITSLRNVPDFELAGNKGVNYINSTHLSGMLFGILLERAGKKYYESFLYDFKYITMMLEAIHLEHYRIMVDNPILRILKKADGMSVAEERNKVLERKEEVKEVKEINLAEVYVDLFKKWTLTSTDLYFYSGDYFLILNPALHQRLVKQINEISGKPIDEDTIIDDLIEKGFADERIVKKSLKLPNGKVSDFSVLPLKAEKVFSQKELEIIKFKKVEIEKLTSQFDFIKKFYRIILDVFR